MHSSCCGVRVCCTEKHLSKLRTLHEATASRSPQRCQPSTASDRPAAASPVEVREGLFLREAFCVLARVLALSGNWFNGRRRSSDHWHAWAGKVIGSLAEMEASRAAGCCAAGKWAGGRSLD